MFGRKKQQQSEKKEPKPGMLDTPLEQQNFSGRSTGQTDLQPTPSQPTEKWDKKCSNLSDRIDRMLLENNMTKNGEATPQTRATSSESNGYRSAQANRHNPRHSAH